MKRRTGLMCLAFVLEAIAWDTAGDPAAAAGALEHAPDLAERDRALLVFILFPAPDLLERHARQHTAHAAHAALLADIRGLLADDKPAPPTAGPQLLYEPPSDSELRVLRYLPTQLSAAEIADQLYVSVNTVKTHTHHLYAKLGVHRRHQAVERARILGLLGPSPRRP